MGTTTVQAQDYLAYYRSVAVAEETLVQKHYDEAVQQYLQAFAAYPYNNPLDCFIAAQVAAYQKDTAACFTFLRRGFCFGLPLSCAQTNLHLRPYIQEEQLSTSINIDSCLSVYRAQINTEARTQMIALFRRDQAVVLHPDTKGLYEPNSLVLKARYRPLWDSLVAAIILLTLNNGFPAEKIIGTQQGDDSLLRPGPHSLLAYYILIHHRHAWPGMQELLLAELHKGNITPQVYAVLADHSNGYSDEAHMRYFALRTCATKACKKELQKRHDEINAARKAIGLCSYETMEQKYAATLQYRKALREHLAPVAAFDFQPDLHFMGQ